MPPVPTVSQALNGRLNAVPGVTDLVAERIYPGTVPQEVAGPTIGFMRTDEDTDDEPAFEADSDIRETLFELVSIGRDYDECEQVHEQVRRALRRFRGTVNGVEVTDMLLRGGEGPLAVDEPASYEATQRVAVRYREV